MMALAYLTAAFAAHPTSTYIARSRRVAKVCSLCMSTYSSDSIISNSLEQGVSRLQTLQTLLSKQGAPGSVGCSTSGGDIVPVSVSSGLVCENLHPHLIPISKSRSTGKYICALKRVNADEDEESSSAPLPIVESGEKLPGMRLLALNSEHLMRRIVCEADASGEDEGIASLYNMGLGSGVIQDKGLDTPYESGAVAKLGYGVEKYVLLRVGPFPDLYEVMAQQHLSKGDEPSSLIAAEAANGKFSGFGSTFAFYSKLLSQLPNRAEEARDTAKVCLRLPISTSGMTTEDLASIASLAGFSEDDDSEEEAVAKLQVIYEKIRQHEQEDDQSGKTPEQIALDEANYLLDTTAMTGADWAAIRKDLGDIYQSAGKDFMAGFVDPSRL